MQVLKNMSADSDSSRLLLMRQGALETGTSWIRALVRERRQNMEQDAGVAGDGAVRAGSNGSGSGSQSLKRMKIEAHVRSVLIQTMALLRNMAVLRYVYSIFSSIFLSWHGCAHLCLSSLFFSSLCLCPSLSLRISVSPSLYPSISVSVNRFSFYLCFCISLSLLMSITVLPFLSYLCLFPSLFLCKICVCPSLSQSTSDSFHLFLCCHCLCLSVSLFSTISVSISVCVHFCLYPFLLLSLSLSTCLCLCLYVLVLVNGFCDSSVCTSTIFDMSFLFFDLATLTCFCPHPTHPTCWVLTLTTRDPYPLSL